MDHKAAQARAEKNAQESTKAHHKAYYEQQAAYHKAEAAKQAKGQA